MMKRQSKVLGGMMLAALLLVGCSRSPQERSASYIEAGKKLLDRHDADRAILQFLNAAKAAPRNGEAYYQLGRAYLSAGDLRKGVASLRKALELNPKHREAQLRLAQLESGTSDPKLLQAAQASLQSILQDSPQDLNVLHSLALTEMKLGDPQEAVDHLEHALVTAPSNLAVTATLAEAKLQQKDYKGAEEVLQSAVANAPKSADAAVLLGRFYVARQQYAPAEQQFQQALTLEPRNEGALLNLATLQDQTGRKQEAERNYQRLSHLPDKAVNFDYGVFLFQQNRKEEALREFERLARADPSDRVARTRLVEAYQASNQAPAADRILTDALKKNPKDLDALLQRGELLIANKKYAEAEADLNQVLHLRPDSAELHYSLAKLYAATGQPRRQRQELTETLRLNPFLVSVRTDAARELIASHEGEAALAVLDAAPSAQKELLAIVEQRNWAFLALGRVAEARQGVASGLATLRTPDLLLQDAFLKVNDKRYAEARQSLLEAFNKTPDDLRILQLLVRSYAIQNQADAAVKQVRALAAQHRDSVPIQFYLGRLLMAAGDRAGAQQVMSAVKEAHPQFAAADLSLAQINLLQAKWKDARQELGTVLTGAGDDATARQWLGMLEATEGNSSAAIANFRKVLENQPNNPVALNNVAFLLAESGKPDEALSYAQKAVELAPNRAEFEDTLGWVLYRKGLYGAAIEHLQSAVSKSGDARLQYHLAAAYFRNGDATRGRAILGAALRKAPALPEAQLAQQAAQEGAPKAQR